jgi:hypothetical protein
VKQTLVGSYILGHEYVDLILREGEGGCFYETPEVGKPARIKIGAEHEQWVEILSVLLHETMELCLDRMKRRYDATQDCGQDHSSYLFVFTHPELSDAMNRVAEYLNGCQEDLRKAWGKWKEEAKGDSEEIKNLTRDEKEEIYLGVRAFERTPMPRSAKGKMAKAR